MSKIVQRKDRVKSIKSLLGVKGFNGHLTSWCHTGLSWNLRILSNDLLMLFSIVSSSVSSYMYGIMHKRKRLNYVTLTFLLHLADLTGRWTPIMDTYLLYMKAWGQWCLTWVKISTTSNCNPKLSKQTPLLKLPAYKTFDWEEEVLFLDLYI